MAALRIWAFAWPCGARYRSEKDVKIITAGDNPARLAAISRGVIQFSVMPEPFVREAEKLGFKDLFDIQSLKIPFWWNAVLAKESAVKSIERY